MPNLVYLNGQIVPEEAAKISVFDHGFLYGDGIFETMRSYKGKVFKLEAHLERLFASAKAIELDLSYSKEALSEAIEATLKANDLLEPDAYIRLSISRGEGPLGIDPQLCSTPTLVIMAKPLKLSEDNYVKGVKVITVNTKRNLIEAVNPAIKSFNFLNNILAKLEINKAKAFEGLMLNYEGYVAEGTISNVFLVKNRSLLTPPATVGILVGITRNTVMEIAKSLGITTYQSKLFQEELYMADEIFLTNSSGEIIPVVEVDGNKIGTGKPGETTLKLLKAYREEASKE